MHYSTDSRLWFGHFLWARDIPNKMCLNDINRYLANELNNLGGLASAW